jgi:uncharacterized membrane protein YebE (DUF533 family)
MSKLIPKQVFLGLAALGWADGRLDPREGQALLHAAKNSGLEGDDLTAVEKATKEKVDIASFEAGELTEWEKVLTYAIASWLARLDGVVTTEEHQTLAKLGDQLNLAKPLRERASAVAFDVAMLPEGNRPEKYDFAALVEKLKARMPAVAKTAPQE